MHGCGNWSRRDLLRVGGLGAAGLALPDLLRARDTSKDGHGASAAPGFGKARSCIFLLMFGGPSQLETFDLKPDAPAELRGEFKPIHTNVGGVAISEHLPQLARRADRYTIVRSLAHGDNFHSSSLHFILTGNPYPRASANILAGRPDDYPHVGSVVARLRPSRNLLPPFVWLPATQYGRLAAMTGNGPGFLGKKYDAFFINKDPSTPDFQVDALAPSAELSLDRLGQRRGLLDTFNRHSDSLLQGPQAAGIDAYYQKALDMIRTPLTQRAFDLALEPTKVRERYGRNAFGQSVLLARRLVEHGVPLITVRFYLDGSDIQDNEPAWDTHSNNFERLKNRLMPPLDLALSALLDDLCQRGLLDETLVVCMGELGRTPRINRVAGRDHHGHCMSLVMAGGGISGGRVYGASDRYAAYPADKPLTPGDIAATIYHCLGIDYLTELPDPHTGRSFRICSGAPIPGLLS
jgi:hypothetical protein